MRVNLTALISEQPPKNPSAMPVKVRIRPFRGMPADHSYMTDSRTLVRMLSNRTDLSGGALDKFETDLRFASAARLFGIELNDQTLREVGFFLD